MSRAALLAAGAVASVSAGSACTNAAIPAYGSPPAPIDASADSGSANDASVDVDAAASLDGSTPPDAGGE